MALSEDKPIPYLVVENMPFPLRYSEQNIRSAMSYQPKSDDVFLVTYPKCGTNWVAEIVALLLRNGVPLQPPENIFSVCSFIDMFGYEVLEKMQRPFAICSHLPYHMAKRSEETKYIYVARNPKDCCVSYYHHMLTKGSKQTFDSFFDNFMNGDVYYGNYFDHILGWYKMRNKPNVLFLTYEQMKANPKEATLKIASFIDEERYAKALREDPQKLANILKCSGFEYLKGKYEDMTAVQIENVANKNPICLDFSSLYRKGLVGDWKKLLSKEQNRRMDEEFEKRMKGTDLMGLWIDCMKLSG